MSFVILDACPYQCTGIDLGAGEVSGCKCKGDGSPCDCPKHIVKTVEKLGCEVTYQGPTHPNLHGTKCEAPYHESPDERHYAATGDQKQDYLAWYTPEQKEKLRALRRAE